MPQSVRKRKQTTVDFSANNKQTEQLSRGMIYRELYLLLNGQLTISTGSNNTAANTNRGDEWALIDRIDVIANNTDVIKSVRGSDLRWLNMLWFGVKPKVSPEIGDGNTNPNFSSMLILPFWLPLGTRPIDTALDARELSDLKIEITWADAAAVNSNASGFQTTPTLEVYSLESFGVEGPFSQWRLFPIEKEITATNPEFQVQLQVGPMYPFFAMFFLDDGADASNILNNFKWRSGTTVFADLNEQTLRESWQMRHGLQRDFDGAAYNDVFISDAADIDGVYFYDHVTDGFLSEAVDTIGFSEHELALDVTKQAGTNKVRVYPHQIIPVRGGNGNG